MLDEIRPTRDELPAKLCELNQWVCWRRESRDGKMTKIPIDPSTGEYASSTDSATWSDFSAAKEYADRTDAEGLGFVFTESDPYVGVDLDDCRVPETGTVQEWATAVIEQLDSYTELSPSGTGFHVLVRGELPGARNRQGDIEIYEDARFFTMTGAHVSETPETIHTRQDALRTVYDEHIAAESTESAATPSDATDGRSRTKTSAESSPLDDDELLERARGAANGEKFRRLWRGNTSGYESHSEADMALCSLLAFWTAGDPDQMDRLFRQSGLMREKWDEVHYSDGSTYGEKTIERAIAGSDEFYTRGADDRMTSEAIRGDSRNLEDRIARLEEREAKRLDTVAQLQEELQELKAENERLSQELAAEREYVQELESELAALRSGSLVSQIKGRIRNRLDGE